MKTVAVAVLLVVGLMTTGCGSNSNNAGNVSGTWNAMLTDTNQSQVFSFSTVLVDNGDGTVTVSKFAFSSNSTCFVSGVTETGSFGLTGNLNGKVSGTFGMTIASGTPSGSVLTLNGTVNGGTVTGKWMLTGSASCTGSGAFTMTKM
jgi:hypothetical protein